MRQFDGVLYQLCSSTENGVPELASESGLPELSSDPRDERDCGQSSLFQMFPPPPWNFHRSSSARHEHKLVAVVVKSFTISIFILSSLDLR
jgi:hypothetical protein